MSVHMCDKSKKISQIDILIAVKLINSGYLNIINYNGENIFV